jgi:capsular polysaccharide transport system permease protein
MISPAQASSEILKAGPPEAEVVAVPLRWPARVRGELASVTIRLGRLLPARGTGLRKWPVPAPPSLSDIRRHVRRPGMRLTRLNLAIASFAGVVAVPSVLAFFYLAMIAAPQFRSETRFVVRGNLETVSGGASPVSGSGAAQVPNSQEARVVVDYLRSRAMVDALQQQLDLRRVFGVAGRDPVFGLSSDASEEDLLAYWNRQVRVSLESLSGVIRVQIHAFSPESAALLGAAIVREAEAVTNALTTRNRGDRVLQADAEEREAFTELAVVRTSLEGFRNAQGTLDPTRSALGSYAVIAKLRDQRSALHTDLTVARARLDEESPVVRALKERMRSLDEKIAALDTDLLGPDREQAGSSGNLKAAAELEVGRRLAEQRLNQAEAELLDARMQQAQKQVYILTFMAPTLPAEKAFPSPLVDAAAVSGILFAAWAVAALYVGSVYARTR